MYPYVRILNSTILCALLLTACSPPSGPVQAQAVQETVRADREKVYKHPAVGETLKIEDALTRALRYNLDTRVADLDELIAADDVTLERLNALPSVSAKIQRVGRNNPGGSSSFSLLTGTQSLQPSISTDQYRNTQLLNVEWDLLDAGIAIGRGRSAQDRTLIAQERRRKVYHGVVQDTYAAFWRVAAAQMALPKIDDLLTQIDAETKTIDEQIKEGIVPLEEARTGKSMLIDKRQQLMTMKQGLMLSEIELKTLIDYPLDQPIALDLGGKDWLSAGSLPQIDESIDKLEDTAFINRPELREEILNKRITKLDMKMTILETLPGAELVLGFNHDSNSFLAYKSWIDGVIGLTQSINKIITAPARYDRAKKSDELADRRRQALVAAIITQVHVAKARYDFLSEVYGQAEAAFDNADSVLKRAEDFKEAGLMSRPKLLNVKIDETVAAVNRALSYAYAQEAYGRFINTMGVDIWDADNAGLDVPDFAKQIRKNLSRDDLFLSTKVDGGVTG